MNIQIQLSDPINLNKIEQAGFSDCADELTISFLDNQLAFSLYYQQLEQTQTKQQGHNTIYDEKEGEDDMDLQQSNQKTGQLQNQLTSSSLNQNNSIASVQKQTCLSHDESTQLQLNTSLKNSSLHEQQPTQLISNNQPNLNQLTHVPWILKNCIIRWTLLVLLLVVLVPIQTVLVFLVAIPFPPFIIIYLFFVSTQKALFFLIAKFSFSIVLLGNVVLLMYYTLLYLWQALKYQYFEILIENWDFWPFVCTKLVIDYMRRIK